MAVFQRARSEEQRQARRQAILGAAAAMRLDFTATLREVLEVMSAGLLARSGRDGH